MYMSIGSRVHPMHRFKYGAWDAPYLFPCHGLGHLHPIHGGRDDAAGEARFAGVMGDPCFSSLSRTVLDASM